MGAYATPNVILFTKNSKKRAITVPVRMCSRKNYCIKYYALLMFDDYFKSMKQSLFLLFMTAVRWLRIISKAPKLDFRLFHLISGALALSTLFCCAESASGPSISGGGTSSALENDLLSARCQSMCLYELEERHKVCRLLFSHIIFSRRETAKRDRKNGENFYGIFNFLLQK